jgi:hypothetical protein
MSNDIMKRMSGAGMDEIDQVDSLPLIKLMQKGSAEVDETHPKYADKGIEGAKAGDLVFHPTGTLLPRPLTFYVLAQRSCYVEWRPKKAGGGVVAHHPLSVTGRSDYRKGSDRSEYDEFLGENDLRFTMYFSVLIEVNKIWTPAIIAMDGSNLSTGRTLTSMIRRFHYPDGIDAEPATFSRGYLLNSTVKPGKDGDGSYCVLTVAPGETLDFDEDSDVELLEMCLDAQESGKQSLPEPHSAPRLTASNDDDEDQPF